LSASRVARKTLKVERDRYRRSSHVKYDVRYYGITDYSGEKIAIVSSLAELLIRANLVDIIRENLDRANRVLISRDSFWNLFFLSVKLTIKRQSEREYRSERSGEIQDTPEAAAFT